MTTSLLLIALLAAPQVTARGPTIAFVEDFEDGANTGGWSFFGNPANPVEVIEPDGGNPGRFLHSTCAGLGCLDTFAPQLRTEIGVDSVFTGDYRAEGVTRLGVDLAIFGPPGVTTAGRPLTLMLRNDGGTPDDFSDDVVVYKNGRRNIPRDDGRWSRYRFRVPATRTTLPAGWEVFQGTGDDDADWNTVITDVTQVTYFFSDPELFFIFQQWELGVDNLSIAMAP
jgi:hypothetical protein